MAKHRTVAQVGRWRVQAVPETIAAYSGARVAPYWRAYRHQPDGTTIGQGFRTEAEATAYARQMDRAEWVLAAQAAQAALAAGGR